MTAREKLERLLRPACGGIYTVSTGTKEQRRLQQRIYGARSDEEVQSRWRASLDRLGWRAQCVVGSLPGLDDIPVPDAQYGRSPAASMADPPGWSTLYLDWKDWAPGMGDHRDSLHAGILITCLDRARNESEPSDTLWIDAPAN